MNQTLVSASSRKPDQGAYRLGLISARASLIDNRQPGLACEAKPKPPFLSSIAGTDPFFLCIIIIMITVQTSN